MKKFKDFKINENFDDFDFDWDEEEPTPNKLNYYVILSIPTTEKSDDVIISSIKRGIIRDLDLKGISKPSDVDIKIK